MKLSWNPPIETDHLARFKWSADHADRVHNGEVDLSGDRTPARPWTEVTIADTNVEELFVEKYDEFDGNIEKAFAAMAEDLGDRFKDTIVNHHWDIKSTGEKLHKDAPNWETIDDSGELADSQSLEIDP